MGKRYFLLLPFTGFVLLGLWLIPARKVDSQSQTIKNVPSEASEFDGPHLAAAQNFEMIKDPALGYPPSLRKIRAYEQMLEIRRNRQAVESAIPGVEWTERGSNNVGGRTRTIMFDPNDPDAKKVWAGAVGGGLWFNNDITDAASNWQNAPNIIDNLAISALAYDPTSPTTFYLGTGLGFTGSIRGEGIWKSTDAGTTWSQLASTTSGFDFVQKIKVTDQGTVLAATLSGIMRSTNGGSSWDNEHSGRIADIEIASNGDIYASTGVSSTGTVVKSTDDGQNWTDITPQTGGRRIELATAPSNPNVIYAVASGGSQNNDVEWFKKSTDGGSTWSSISIPNYMNQSCSMSGSHYTRGQSWFDLILAVQPEDENVIIAGGIDLHKSEDGGETWYPISYWTGGDCDEFVHADQHEIQFRPGFPNEALFGNDGGIDYSRDVGSSDNPDFDRRVRGYNTMLFYAVAMANESGSNVMLAGAQDNGTQRFAEPGINSTRQVAGGDGAFCFIDQNNSDLQISSYVFNVFRLSTNGGKSFSTISSDQQSGRFINPADYDDFQGMLFSAGANNQLKRIQGITSTPQAQETITLTLGNDQVSTIKISPNQEKRLFVGTGGGNIYRIDSTHKSSMVVTALNGTFEGSPGQYVSSIDVGETDDHLLATFSNYGVTSVYETTDGGETWANKEGNLPDIPVRWGLFNPENTNEVLIATELGVWSTGEFSSSSPDWEPSNSGLASVRTDMLKYRSADKQIAAATYGRGVFTSNIFSDVSLADFTTDRQVAYAGTSIQFTEASHMSENSYMWDFGDGNTSNERHPDHTYTNAGTYTVSLSVANGNASETKTDFISVLPNKNTPYTLADGGDFEDSDGDFASASLLHEIDLWETGAPSGTLNQPSSGAKVWKTGLSTTISDIGYDHSSALYTPAFDLSDTDKDYTLKFNLSMESGSCSSPTGLYMEYSLDGGLNWQILGSSRRSVGDDNWYNKGDNLVCSINFDISEDKMGWTAANSAGDFNIPVKTKLNHLAGNSSVAFRFVVGVVSGFGGSGYGKDGFMIDDFEIYATGPTADFEATPTRTVVNTDIQFSYASQGADSFLWDFGDGNTSTEMNPVHQYSSGGSYTVSLTVMTGGNSIVETKTDYITIISSKTLPYLTSDGGDFETNQSDFYVNNLSGTGFELGQSSIPGKSGTASGNFAWVTGIDEDNYVDDSRAELISPTFIFDQNLVSTLEFKANFDFEDNWDGFIVEYTTNGGADWTKLNAQQEAGWYNQITDPQAIFGAQVPIFSGDTGGQFETFSTDVSFLYPNEAVGFRFLFLSDGSVTTPGVAIDDFQILVQSPEAPSAAFTASTTSVCEGESVIFTSTSTGTISNYQWSFGNNASPASATGVGPHEVTYSGSESQTVGLTVSNQFNEQSEESKPDFINVNELHEASFEIQTSGSEGIQLLASEGDSYQWFYRNEAIAGATERSYLALESGLYTVEVTIGGCTDRSISRNLVITGLEADKRFANSITIYPNPVTDRLRIAVSNSVMGTHHFSVFSLSGKRLSESQQVKDEQEEIFELDASALKPGQYLIRIVSPEGTAIKKVWKQ